jgi:hypothetical protein
MADSGGSGVKMPAQQQVGSVQDHIDKLAEFFDTMRKQGLVRDVKCKKEFQHSRPVLRAFCPYKGDTAVGPGCYGPYIGISGHKAGGVVCPSCGGIAYFIPE